MQNKCNWTKVQNLTGFRYALRHVLRAPLSLIVGATWFGLRLVTTACFACRFTVHHDAFIVHRPHPFGEPATATLKAFWDNNRR